jgi:hypothetical protein
MHKFLTGWERTDHKDRDGLNNQRINLRPATQRQNVGNSPQRSGNQSGYKGVHLHKASGLYMAQLRPVGAKYAITAQAAAILYDEMALEYFGEYAITNRSLGLLPREQKDPSQCHRCGQWTALIHYGHHAPWICEACLRKEHEHV